MFFGGNLLRQPVFVQLRKDRPNSFRVVSADGRALVAEPAHALRRVETVGASLLAIPDPSNRFPGD